MSYSLGDSNQYTAYVGDQNDGGYYGRSGTIPEPSSGTTSTPASSSSSESADTSAADTTGGGGGGSGPSYATDAAIAAGGGITVLVGVGVVAALGYFLFFRGGR